MKDTFQMREHQNLGTTERLATLMAGAGLLALAARTPRARRPLAAASAALLIRGATGFCPAYAATGRSSRGVDSRQALTGSKGSHVDAHITIGRPREVVYLFWKQLDRLAAALPDSIRVQQLDDRRSRWSLARTSASEGPVAEWTAEIINDEPSDLIAWKTIGQADVASAGSVHFRDAPGSRGTEVRVRMQYSPPFGRLAASLAGLFGRGADQMVRECLRDIKRHLELGGAVTLTGK